MYLLSIYSHNILYSNYEYSRVNGRIKNYYMFIQTVEGTILKHLDAICVCAHI